MQDKIKNNKLNTFFFIYIYIHIYISHVILERIYNGSTDAVSQHHTDFINSKTGAFAYHTPNTADVQRS